MSLFAFRAIDADGRLRRGRTDAPDLDTLEDRLRRQGLDLVAAHPARPPLWSRPPPRRELIHFCFHLEQLLRAGVPILESLADLRDATEHARFRLIVTALATAIEGGRSLSQAMEEHPLCFDRVFRSLIRAGEEAGELPRILAALSTALKRDDELAAHTRRMMIYPAIVCVVILAAILVALLFVVPELARLFHTAGQNLPLQTRLLIALADAVRNYGLPLAVALAVALTVLRHAIAEGPEFRLRWDAWRLRLPFIGELHRKLILARFSGLFALMYQAGIPIVDALAVARDGVGNAAVEIGLQRAEEEIRNGRRVSEAFQDLALFPPLVGRMLRVGENTGALDQALANVGYFYERDVKESIASLQAAIEPALTLILGGLLLLVMSAVLMPIYDIVTRLKI